MAPVLCQTIEHAGPRDVEDGCSIWKDAIPPASPAYSALYVDSSELQEDRSGRHQKR